MLNKKNFKILVPEPGHFTGGVQVWRGTWCKGKFGDFRVR